MLIYDRNITFIPAEVLELSSDSKSSLCCIAKQHPRQHNVLLISLSPILAVRCRNEIPDLGKKIKEV